MKMQAHILAAMREQFEQWQTLLGSMSEEQIHAPLVPSQWSVKDEIAHLRAWQERSIERVNAALEKRAPNLPKWLGDTDLDEDVDGTNAAIYEMNRERAWSSVFQNWREGFSRFIELGEKFSEPQFLDSSRYAWMEGAPIAFVYIASYDHHQEHFEKLAEWLEAHAGRSSHSG